MSTNKFVVSHLEEQIGPFDELELKAKWSRGEILPIDYVYDEGQQDWVLITEKFSWANKPAKKAVEPTVATAPVHRAQAPVHDTQKLDLIDDAHTQKIEIEDDDAVTSPNLNLGRNHVELVNGVGEIDLASLHPGTVELRLEDRDSGALRLETPHQIQIKVPEAVELIWNLPDHLTVGQTLELFVRALDERGQICVGYEETFQLQLRGPRTQDIPLKMVNGQVTFQIQNTVSEAWKIALVYAGKKRLRLPEMRTLEWQAGQPKKLVIEGPHESIAGQPLRVQVKAVDEYGNTAKHYQGTVALEVKAG